MRKTINGDDLLWSINELAFEHYVKPLQAHLAQHRDAAKRQKAAGVGQATSEQTTHHPAYPAYPASPPLTLNPLRHLRQDCYPMHASRPS